MLLDELDFKRNMEPDHYFIYKIQFTLPVKVQASVNTTLHRQAKEAYRRLISVVYALAEQSLS